MNWTTIEGRWLQMKGEVRQRWAKLTDEDIEILGAKKDQLVGKLVERYGIMRDEAEHQIDDWLHKLDAKVEARKNERKSS
jgi:uncharacterized protein YjbJ (UPF0337 family)